MRSKATMLRQFVDKLYSTEKKSLLCFSDSSPDPSFWNKRWEKLDLNRLARVTSRSYIVKVTKKYLPINARVLEGGCGAGDKVLALTNAGYDCIGIDTAAITINNIKKIFPDLSVQVGDVTKLTFPNNYFDGYWSLGVIEHDIKGFSSIRDEMLRVLKKGGYLFLTFPHMNLLRKLNAALGFYPPYKPNSRPAGYFYQYIYNAQDIKEHFSRHGFDHVLTRYLSSFHGLEYELPILNALGKLMQSNGVTKIMYKLIKVAIDNTLNLLLGKFISHGVLLVFKKT